MNTTRQERMAAELLRIAARELVNDDEAAAEDSVRAAREQLDRGPYPAGRAAGLVEAAAEGLEWKGHPVERVRLEKAGGLGLLAAAILELATSRELEDRAGKLPSESAASVMGREFARAAERVAAELARAGLENLPGTRRPPIWVRELSTLAPVEEVTR
jgi:hypothetical protein